MGVAAQGGGGRRRRRHAAHRRRRLAAVAAAADRGGPGRRPVTAVRSGRAPDARPALARGRAVHHRDRVPDPDSDRRARDHRRPRGELRDRPGAQDDRDRRRLRPDREGTRPDRRRAAPAGEAAALPDRSRAEPALAGRPVGAGRDVGRALGPGARRLAAGADVDRALLPAARRPRAGRLVHRRNAAPARTRAHDDARIPRRRALGAGRELHHGRGAGGRRHDRLLHRAARPARSSSACSRCSHR